MATLLQIDSSPAYSGSISRELTAAFVERWKDAHPGGRVIVRDLNATSIPPLTAEWIGASYTPESNQSQEQKCLLQLSNTLLSEIAAADEWVIGVPMHNFSISAPLKLWIDQIVRAGKTFQYVEGKSKGMLTGKKVTFIVATGGMYDAGTQMASFDHVEPYLRSICAFIGVGEPKFLTAGGTAALRQGKDRNEFLAPHIQAVRNHVELPA